MRDSIIIGFLHERSQRDNVFGVVVLDGVEIAKFAVVGCIVGNEVASLNIDATCSWFRADKVYLACLQLSHGDVITKANEVVVNDVLDDLFDVALTVAACKSVADAVVFEVEFVVALKQALAVNVIAVDLVEHIGVAKEFCVVDDGCRGDRLALRLHVFGDAVGRNDLASIVGKETHQIFEERNVAYLVAHDDVLQQHGVDDVRLIFMGVLFVQAVTHQTGQTSELYVLRQCLVAVRKIVENEKLLVAQGLNVDFFVPTANLGAEITAEHTRIASGDDEFHVGLLVIAAHALFEFLDVLNFVNENVVHPALVALLVDVGIQVKVVADAVKILFLLIYIDDVVFGILSHLLLEQSQNETLSDSSLACQNDDSVFSKIPFYLVKVMLSLYGFHVFYK